MPMTIEELATIDEEASNPILRIEPDRSMLSGAGVSDSDVDRLRNELADIVATTGPTLVVEPIVHIQSRTQVGGEALARFPGSIATREWFAIADAFGVKTDLELRIISDVAAKATAADGFLSANVSPETLFDPRCADVLQQRTGAEVVLELTDHESVPKLTVLRRHLDDLRDLGVRVAVHVSSFGVDTTRLLMLAAPDVVKLDPSLSAGLSQGAHDSIAASNFFAYCRQEGVFVVAVGVTSKHELAALHDRGVDAAQGRQLDLD
jgi:EAL domain-containing protein (putative c-di-GMP-specific phosphodiesterase class I)